jgi:MFS family permease
MRAELQQVFAEETARVFQVLRFNVPIFTSALVLIGLIGVAIVVSSTSQSTLLQQSVPDEYRGRVFGAFGSTSALLSLAGMLLGGLAGDKVGVVPMLNLSGALTILAGVVVVFLLRAQRDAPAADAPTAQVEKV